jgi:hypothetical protein
MAYSTLQRKTPLKAKTPLRAKTALKASNNLRSNSTLRTKKSLSDSYKEKIRLGETKPKKRIYVYKPKYKYESIFTNDLSRCYITGSTKAAGASIHIHHIFGASNKTKSEKYHFLIPLRDDWHDMADYGIHFNRKLELKIKRQCQEYWLAHYGTKEEFIKVFGKWW